MKTIALVFFALSVSLFALNHSSALLSSVFARRKVSEELEPVIWKVVSSANRIEKNLEAFGKSLMKNRKRSGPRQLPCGTPHLHSRRQELKNSPLRLRLTYCVLLVR